MKASKLENLTFLNENWLLYIFFIYVSFIYIFGVRGEGGWLCLEQFPIVL